MNMDMDTQEDYHQTLMERTARLSTDLLMAMQYEDFIISLRDWSESTIIASVKPLVSIVSQLNYANKGTTYDSKVKTRNYLQGVNTWKNVQRLFNRKLTPLYSLGIPEKWMEPSIYQDFIGHLDEETKFMFERHSEKYKNDWREGRPTPYGASHLDTHPLERYGGFPRGWTDENGKTLQDYKDEITRDLLDAAETNKDSDYVNKSAATYLSAKPYLLPHLTADQNYWKNRNENKYGWDYLINEWTPLFTSQMRQELNHLFGNSRGSYAWGKVDTIYQPLYDQIKEREEKLDLDDLLKEMSYLLEVFNLYEPVLKLSHFEIKSVYGDDGIDYEGMEEQWRDSIRDDLSGDDLERFDNDSEEFISWMGYDINDYINDYSWDSPDLSRHHNNQVMWKWKEGAVQQTPDLNDTIEIDGEQMSNFAYMPSPFTKQYVPFGYNWATNIQHFAEPTNELIGMKWGDYAWPNIYLHQNQVVNENPATLNSPFIPFNLPLDLRRLRYLAGRPILHRSSVAPKFVEDFDFSEPMIDANIRGEYGKLFISARGEREKKHEPIIPGVDEGKYGTSIPGTEPKIPKFEEETMGLHHFDIRIIVEFIAQAAPIINYVRNKPEITHKSSTN